MAALQFLIIIPPDDLEGEQHGQGQREPVEGDSCVTARAPGVLTEPLPQVRDRRWRLEQRDE